jgi:hypothetical protein
LESRDRCLARDSEGKRAFASPEAVEWFG